MIVVEDPFAAPVKEKVVLTACGPSQTSTDWPEKGHGLFTYFLLLGMRGDADESGDGYVDIDEVFSYIKPRVAEQAKRLGEDQTPEKRGSGSGIKITQVAAK